MIKLSNCVLSVGGGSEQFSRDLTEFQALVPPSPRSVGKKKINRSANRLVMEPNPKLFSPL